MARPVQASILSRIILSRMRHAARPALPVILASCILISTISPSYADELVTVNTVANVSEHSLLSAVSNLQEYPKIFPQNIRSVSILNKTSGLVEINAGLDGLFFDTEAVCNKTSAGTYSVTVVSGDLKGTSLVTRLSKTWGFDGSAGMGTKVGISLDLKMSGLLSWMTGFIPKSSLTSVLQYGFARFVGHAGSP
ncbi:MAG: hypothetical protein KGI33_05410 [Thaumarchaeota archaeon]|nr:hypothetical protein [Nitrososphaerota archaeon]